MADYPQYLKHNQLYRFLISVVSQEDADSFTLAVLAHQSTLFNAASFIYSVANLCIVLLIPLNPVPPNFYLI